ncbi:MAG: hypothetical protein HDS26_03855 [Bacteroides sp.]|nr:hypothetical protein [Bacteroides sp.]
MEIKFSKLEHLKNPRDVLLSYRAAEPMCSNYGESRIIHLSITKEDWGRILYQYAHEYCHHLIDGKMIGIEAGLAWFEECLCEVSSRFVLKTLGEGLLLRRAGHESIIPVIRHYLTYCMPLDGNLKREFEMNGGIGPWEHDLYPIGSHREHYSVIANAILPLFCTNPGLWQILGHIGNSDEWQSLEELLAHLQSTVDEHIRKEVNRMRKVLLGR